MKRFGLLLALAAVGCAGPRPAVPASSSIAPPARWRDVSVTRPAPIDPAWWSRFGDPTLTGLVAEALAHNDDIAIAAARVEEARAQFGLARGASLPAVSLAAGGGPQRAVNAFGIGTDQTAGQAQLAISYDLDLFGRLRSVSKAGRASLFASEAARDTVRLGVASSVASGYLTLRSLDARLGVLRETLGARKAALAFAVRRSEAGYAPDLDRAQAEADYRATEQLIPLAELAIRRQEDGLSILLGYVPRDIARGRALADLVVPEVALGVPTTLLRQRPDIAQAEEQLVAADHQLDGSRAAFLPNVQLSAAGGMVASTLLSDPVSIFSVGGSILAPLFQGGRLRAQADIQASRRDQAAFGYRRTVLGAFREVEDALAEQRLYAEQEHSLAAQREALASALHRATNRYRAGYSPYLEQLDAQRGLLAADLALVQARQDRLTAAVHLFQATGGGWGVGER